MNLSFHLVETEINFINKTVASVYFQILCETQYINQNDISLTVELKELYGGVVNSTLVQCANNVQFQSLSRTTSYELIIYWTSLEGSKCYINSTDNVFTSLQSYPLSAGEIAAVVISNILLPLSAVVTVLTVIWKFSGCKVRDSIIIYECI